MSFDFPWLTVLMAVPLVGAAVVTLLPKRADGVLAKQVALGASLRLANSTLRWSPVWQDK